MITASHVVQAVRSGLRKNRRIGERERPISLDCRDGVLFMEGELDSVAAKRLAIEQAAKVRGVIGIVDRLRVAPAERLDDAEVARRLAAALIAEGAFRTYVIADAGPDQAQRILHVPGRPRGTIAFRVVEGVIRLDGVLPALEHKRWAGVLAWWVPGTREVVNGIAVDPPGEDGDGPVADVVRAVLQRDARVNAARLRVRARNGTVFLSGCVSSRTERAAAEKDAWFVLGVDRVVSELVVRR